MVPAAGPRDAKIALVGEAPGDQEVREGLPFVGTAGQLLNGMLTEVGIKREDCYITNILQEQPTPDAATSAARNHFGALYEDAGRKQPSGRLLTNVERLKLELEDVAPNVIVALGQEPLRWLTGKSGITNWRGSVLEGEGVGKVIPTYHPAYIARQWDWRPIAVFDLRKAVSEAAFPTIKRRPRNMYIAYEFDRTMEALKAFQDIGSPCAFDIEVETQQVSSIAFAQSPETALVIPIWWGLSGSKWSPADEQLIWEQIGQLFATTPMVGQNVHYDLTYLRLYEVYSRCLYMDTMVAFHVLYPELPKGLDFMASLYTDLPYWKGMRTTSDEQEFYRYNGLDALATIECAQRIEEELKEG